MTIKKSSAKGAPVLAVAKTPIKYAIFFCTVFFQLFACTENPKPSYEDMEKSTQLRLQEFVNASQEIDFHGDIKPIIDRKCLSCHACFDAPCQLKMENIDGLLRGASKEKVYSSKRLNDVPPTRLGVDAQTAAQWRDKGFYSVIDGAKHSDSIMKKMLVLGKENAIPTNKSITKDTIALGAERDSYCASEGEFSDYMENNPLGGMPLAVSGLTDSEYHKLIVWLEQGSVYKEQELKISSADKNQIAIWEDWLNQNNNQQQLLSRYIYEHLILGNLYLQPDSITVQRINSDAKPYFEPVFYKLVRSTTPPGTSVRIIATALPNEPAKQPIYYRLIPVKETLVYKNHIPYRFDQERLEQYRLLFDKKQWSSNTLPGYGYDERANPFKTFKAIPAKSRYQFLLNDAEYFVRNFIRGPVCHGPIATDVIRDRFWIMFESPQYEQFVNDERYQHQVTPLLGLPGEKTQLTELGEEWLAYKQKRNDYRKLRDTHYKTVFDKGAEYQHIWTDNNPGAFLSIFRHHNNASVTNGWKGDYPLTAWVLDYPLFERSYYELVAGFNVFGSLSHQVQTRLYFDLIRNGGEANFLRFMPPAERKSMYDSWYEGLGKIKASITYHALDADSPVAIKYDEKAGKNAFFNFYFTHYSKETEYKQSTLTCDVNCSPSQLIDSKLSRIAGIKAESLKIINFLPDVTFLSVRSEDTVYTYTLTRDRMHTNVAFMLGEKIRYKENQDTLSILPEITGSYPNLMLSVNVASLDEFINALQSVSDQKMFDSFIDRFAVRRMSNDFWQRLTEFENSVKEKRPIEAGVMDISRYGYW